MEFRDFLLFLHIAGAGSWLGANVVQMLVPRLALIDGDATAAGWMRITGDLSKRLYIPAGVTVLLTGVLLVLVSDGAFTFADRFVGVGFAVGIIGAILGPVVFAPGAEKAAQAIESGDKAETVATTSRLARWGAVDTALVLLAIAVMIMRWN